MNISIIQPLSPTSIATGQERTTAAEEKPASALKKIINICKKGFASPQILLNFDINKNNYESLAKAWAVLIDRDPTYTALKKEGRLSEKLNGKSAYKCFSKISSFIVQISGNPVYKDKLIQQIVARLIDFKWTQINPETKKNIEKSKLYNNEYKKYLLWLKKIGRARALLKAVKSKGARDSYNIFHTELTIKSGTKGAYISTCYALKYELIKLAEAYTQLQWNKMFSKGHIIRRIAYKHLGKWKAEGLSHEISFELPIMILRAQIAKEV